MDIQVIDSMRQNRNAYQTYFLWCQEMLKTITPEELEATCDKSGLIDGDKLPERIKSAVYNDEANNPFCRIFPNSMDAFLFAIGLELRAYNPAKRVIFTSKI